MSSTAPTVNTAAPTLQAAPFVEEIKAVHALYCESAELDSKLRRDKQSLSDAQDEVKQQHNSEQEAETKLILVYKKDIKKQEQEIAKLTATQLDLIIKNDAKQQEKQQLLDMLAKYKQLEKEMNEKQAEIAKYENKYAQHKNANDKKKSK